MQLCWPADTIARVRDMKVVFSNALPFSLAHGGVQTVIESIWRELEQLGVTVEAERWEDASQSADILHYFGRPVSALNVSLAQEKGRRVVMTEYLDQTASRSRMTLAAQKFVMRMAQRLLPNMTQRMAWTVYRQLDAMIYTTSLELDTAINLFNARPERGHIVPHGISAEALVALAEEAPVGDYLVSVATVAPRKNTVALARAAHAAKVPVVFLGKPYSEVDNYFRQFKELIDGKWVRYPGYVAESEKHRWLREARGFVLLSEFESGCVAVYEAAAAGLPLLLSDRPWATQCFPQARALSFVEPGSAGELGRKLRAFHEDSRRTKEATFPVSSWRELAEKYLAVYESVLLG